MLGLVLVGCGGSASTSDSGGGGLVNQPAAATAAQTATATVKVDFNTPVTTTKTAAATATISSLPANVDSFRVTGYDINGRIVYGASVLPRPASDILVVEVPVEKHASVSSQLTAGGLHARLWRMGSEA